MLKTNCKEIVFMVLSTFWKVSMGGGGGGVGKGKVFSVPVSNNCTTT